MDGRKEYAIYNINTEGCGCTSCAYFIDDL